MEDKFEGDNLPFSVKNHETYAEAQSVSALTEA